MRLRIVTPLAVVSTSRRGQRVARRGRQRRLRDSAAVTPISSPASRSRRLNWQAASGGRRYCAVRGGVLTVAGGDAISRRDARGGARRRSADAARDRARAAFAPTSRPSDRARRERAPASRTRSARSCATCARIGGAARTVLMTPRPQRRDARRRPAGARRPESDALVSGASCAASAGGAGCARASRRPRASSRQIGVLGWIIVDPTLSASFIGRWLDRAFQSGIFWTAPLLMLGVALGCWSAWRWMNAHDAIPVRRSARVADSPAARLFWRGLVVGALYFGALWWNVRGSSSRAARVAILALTLCASRSRRRADGREPAGRRAAARARARRARGARAIWSARSGRRRVRSPLESVRSSMSARSPITRPVVDDLGDHRGADPRSRAC